MKSSYLPLLLAVLFCCFQTVSANDNTGSPLPNDKTSLQEGTIHGYVVDAATKRPVAGVTVTASHQKRNTKREASTDASGYFKLDEMPMGEILIYFDKKGYRMLKKNGIRLREGTVLKLSIDIQEDEADPVFEHPALRLLDGIF